MNDQQEKEQYSEVRNRRIRAALDQHWAASDALAELTQENKRR